MSAVIHNAGTLKADIRLALAVSGFEADLSAKHKATLRAYKFEALTSPPDVRDIMRLTAEFDRCTSRAVGSGRCFGPRMTNALHAVQQFAALGDIIVGGSQNLVACGVWSVVRITLLSAAIFSSCVEKLTAFFMVVGRSAPRYDRMALLYPRSTTLQSYLSEYYIVIVRFCRQLMSTTSKSTLGQFFSFLSDFDLKTYQSDLDQWAASIKEEITILHIGEQKANIQSAMSLSSLQRHQQRLKSRQRVLDACSTHPYETTWKETRKAGHTILFNKMPEYTEWKTRNEPCTLFCVGGLGAGKSVLLANIVDDLNLYTNHSKAPVAYFFCRYDLAESVKARTVIGSLVKQLLRFVPDLKSAEKRLLHQPAAEIDIRLLSKILIDSISPGFRAYFVLDGIDELDNEQADELISQLKSLQNRLRLPGCGSTLLICVSVRLEANTSLMIKSGRFTNVIQVAMPEENPDIKAYIASELKRCLASKRLVLGNPEIVLEIQDILAKGAKGMFLWVSLQIVSICAAKTDQELRNMLADLPKDLPETFSRILTKSLQPGINYQTRVLELVLGAIGLLTLRELGEALSVTEGDITWNTEKQLNDVYAAMASCGSLIVIDEELLTVRFIHHSVKKFLLSNVKAANVKLSMEQAKTTMASIILTYLNYDVFDMRLSAANLAQIETTAIPSKIVRSIYTPDAVRSIALKLLKSQPNSNFDVGKALQDATRNCNPSSAGDFPFYAYASSYWLHHICQTPRLPQEVMTLLVRLFRQPVMKQLAQVEVFDMESKNLDSAGNTLLAMAARNGYEFVVQLLLDKGGDIETRDSRQMTPLLHAVSQDHHTVVGLLLKRGANISARNQDNLSCLELAWDRGHDTMADILLTSRSTAYVDQPSVSLHIAAINIALASSSVIISLIERQRATAYYGWFTARFDSVVRSCSWHLL